MGKPSISELEALRAKMTPGVHRQGSVAKFDVYRDIDDSTPAHTSFESADDAAWFVAMNNAMPALLALAKAALELRDARKAYLVSGWRSVEEQTARARLNEAHAAYTSALQAVRP